MSLPVLEMERWQSRYEDSVRCNLSGSGVLPFTLSEFCELADVDPTPTRLGYGSTDGTETLRELIAGLYPDATADNVLVTSGSAEANFLAMWCLVEPGARVVIVEPIYGQTPGLARGLGADVVSLRLEEAHGWQPASDAVGRAITPDTSLVVLTNPNNPTATVLSAASRAEIVRAAEAAGAWIVTDEVYAGAELGAPDTPSTATLWGAASRIVATASLSKAYGLPGLRLGWLVAPQTLRERAWARKDYTTIAPAVLSDRLAVAALDPGVRPRIIARCRKLIRSNLSYVLDWAAGIPTLGLQAPDAGPIMLIRYDDRFTSHQLAERLRAEWSVLIVPGSHFGIEHTFRIGFGYEAEALASGLAAITEALAGPVTQ